MNPSRTLALSASFKAAALLTTGAVTYGSYAETKDYLVTGVICLATALASWNLAHTAQKKLDKSPPTPKV